MHGNLHLVLKGCLAELTGDDACWTRVLDTLRVADEAAFLQPVQHSDALTLAALSTAARYLDLPRDDFMRAYGVSMAKFLVAGPGHRQMLESLGETTLEFVKNINFLHHCLAFSFRSANFPFFSSAGAGTDAFELLYASSRGRVLAPLIEGVLPTMAALLHAERVEMERMALPRQGFDVGWRVRAAPLDGPPPAPPALSAAELSSARSSWHAALVSAAAVDLEQLCAWAAASGGAGADVRAVQALLRHPDLDMAQRGAQLMRAVPASCVCADWFDAERFEPAARFWQAPRGTQAEYALSRPAASAQRFVSHVWSAPPDWAQVMGPRAQYAAVKASALYYAVADLGGVDGWAEFSLWVDKSCIVQTDGGVKAGTVAHLEQFLRRSDGLLMLLSWDYFSRLWCVYEYSVFIALFDPRQAYVSVDAFMRPASQPRFLSALEGFSVGGAKCGVEADRPVLRAKIGTYFVSEPAFEEFAKATAIALIAIAMCRRAGRSQHVYQEDYAPWVQLAARLGYTELERALRAADPVAWRNSSRPPGLKTAALGRVAADWHARYLRRLRSWCEASVYPALEKHRAACVLPRWTSARAQPGPMGSNASIARRVAGSSMGSLVEALAPRRMVSLASRLTPRGSTSTVSEAERRATL